MSGHGINRRGFMVGVAALVPAIRGRAQAALSVFAAASLRDALSDAGRAFAGPMPVLTFAGSGTLARQIAAGAPADIFISANAAWMDHLVDRGAVAEGAQVDLLTNTLVLAGLGDAAPQPLAEALAVLPPDARIATGFVEAVPAGIYTRQALTALGLWEAFAPRLVQVENVRLALALAARGEVAAAFVYRSDVAATPSVTAMAEVPGDLHDEIRYPAAPVAARPHPQVDAFLAHLQGAAAQAIFRAHGFEIPA